MKETPIIFNTEMVQAILEGRKTQTRRLITPQPKEGTEYMGWLVPKYEHIVFGNKPKADSLHKNNFGNAGDLLYVREKFEVETDGKVKFYAGNIEVEHNAAYRRLTKWKPSIHMPKVAARIWLQVVEVKAERLHDISENDAIAEGIKADVFGYECPICNHDWHNGDELLCDDGFYKNPIKAFQVLWQSIHNKESWDSNPWVWVIKFKVISTTGKPTV